MATWDDVPHLDEAAKADMLSSYPSYQRNARSKGIPMLGSGAIYPVAEEDYVVDGFAIPVHWPRSYGLDVGWKTTAAIWGAWDRETDVMYAYDEYYRHEAEPSVHAAAIRKRGDWMQGVIDPASRGRGQDDGRQLLAQYVEQQLNLTCADNGVESGIYAVYDRLTTGRLKIMKHLTNTLMEIRLYRRDDKGKVVKKLDHAMDALRYEVVSGYAVASPAPNYLQRGGGGGMGVKSEYDPYQLEGDRS